MRERRKRCRDRRPSWRLTAAMLLFTSAWGALAQHQGRSLLVTGNKAAALKAAKTCMAEEPCLEKSCGKGYDHAARKFPYRVTYTKRLQPDSTRFDFKVCLLPCTKDHIFCEPLKAWALRLDTRLVENGHFIRASHPEGRLQTECSETGLGFRWEGEAALRGLGGPLPPRGSGEGERCEEFGLEVTHDPHMTGHYWLTDVCQQGIEILVSKNGQSLMTPMSLIAHDKYSDVGSCLVHFQSAGGTWGFLLLEDADYAAQDARPPENMPDEAYLNAPAELVDHSARV